MIAATARLPYTLPENRKLKPPSARARLILLGNVRHSFKRLLARASKSQAERSFDPVTTRDAKRLS